MIKCTDVKNTANSPFLFDLFINVFVGFSMPTTITCMFRFWTLLLLPLTDKLTWCQIIHIVCVCTHVFFRDQRLFTKIQLITYPMLLMMEYDSLIQHPLFARTWHSNQHVSFFTFSYIPQPPTPPLLSQYGVPQ